MLTSQAFHANFRLSPIISPIRKTPKKLRRVIRNGGLALNPDNRESGENIIDSEVVEETDFTSFVQKVRKNQIDDVYMKPAWEKDSTLSYSANENGVIIHGETNGFITEGIIHEMIDHGVLIHVENTVSMLSNSVVTIILFSFFYALFMRSLPPRIRNEFKFEDNEESSSKSNEIGFDLSLIHI